MSDIPVHQNLAGIQTLEDLSQFITQLRTDFLIHSEEWQNTDMSACLEAMAAWISDAEASRRTTGDSLLSLSPLQLCAQILYAAKVYE